MIKNLNIEYDLRKKVYKRSLFKINWKYKEKLHNRFLQLKKIAQLNSICKIRWMEDVRDLNVK